MKRIGVWTVAALATFTFALAGCTKKEEPGTGAIKIGIAGPITGPYAKFGEQLVMGTTMLAERVNAAGGIDGRKIEIVRGDDQCDPKQARSVANRMVSDKVAAVVGHFCSSSTIPASEVYAENNLLMITPASTNPQVTERGLEAVFRTCFRDDQQGNYAGDYIAGVLKPKAVAVIHDKDTYGQGLADATRARLKEKYGIEAKLYEGITRGDKDFNSLVTKMKGLKVDTIYFGGLHTEAGLIARQAQEQGLKATFISGDGIVTEEFPNIAGPATEGVLMSFGADPRSIPEAADAVKAFRDAKYEPEAYTLYAFAAIQSIAAALTANETSKDGKKLATWLKANSVQTVMGKKEWDSKGDLKVSDYVMYKWSKGADGKFNYTELPLK